MKQFYSDRLAIRQLNLRDRPNLAGLLYDWGLARQNTTAPDFTRKIESIIARAINDCDKKTGYIWGKDEAFAVSLKNGTEQMQLIGYIEVKPADASEAELSQ